MIISMAINTILLVTLPHGSANMRVSGLGDASISMYDLVTACTLVGDDKSRGNNVTVATMQSRAQITNILIDGRSSGSELAMAMKRCCETNAHVRESARALLLTGHM